MQKSKVGIIGGAGPLAGVVLLEKIIQIAQSKYGCHRDADFPFILLLNYPFEEMLSCQASPSALRGQLAECFARFEENGIDLVVIACNTLHAFLPPISGKLRFINLIEKTNLALKQEATKNTLILSTSTSVQHNLYGACNCPNRDLQADIDAYIDQILAGAPLAEISSRLAKRLNQIQRSTPITLVLACTDLSALNERAPLKAHGLTPEFVIYDPLVAVAEMICNYVYSDLDVS